MIPDALARVPLELRGRPVVLKAELADVYFGQGAEVVRVGALVPNLHLVAAHFEVPGLPSVWKSPHVFFDHLASLCLGLAEDLQVPF